MLQKSITNLQVRIFFVANTKLFWICQWKTWRLKFPSLDWHHSIGRGKILIFNIQIWREKWHGNFWFMARFGRHDFFFLPVACNLYSIARIIWPSLIRTSWTISTINIYTITCLTIDFDVWIIHTFCLIRTNILRILVRIIRAPLYFPEFRDVHNVVTFKHRIQ